MTRGQDDLGSGREGLQALADHEPIVARKVHVQKNNVRPERGDGIHGASPIRGLADDAESVITVEHLSYNMAKWREIVHDQDAAHRTIVARAALRASGRTLDRGIWERANAGLALRHSRAHLDVPPAPCGQC